MLPVWFCLPLRLCRNGRLNQFLLCITALQPHSLVHLFVGQLASVTVSSSLWPHPCLNLCSLAPDDLALRSPLSPRTPLSSFHFSHPLFRRLHILTISAESALTRRASILNHPQPSQRGPLACLGSPSPKVARHARVKDCRTSISCSKSFLDTAIA